MRKIIFLLFLLILIPKGILCTEENVRRLSIDDVSRLALENSLDIQITQFDILISQTSLLKAESIFDIYF
ncbi:MAG: hypothetical protein DRP76_04495, partial [Candidatus Omnitrophota bacterium]